MSGEESRAPETAAEAAAGASLPLEAVVEGVLFAAAEPVPLRRLSRLLNAWSRREIEAAVASLRDRLEREGRGIRLVEAAGGLQLRSADGLAVWLRRFFAERPPRLSRPVLETVAIVAYRQPVTRGEIERIRGVNCEAVIAALLGRGLIEVAGRRDTPGRPVEYRTTDAFLELFTLRDLSELPPLPERSTLATLAGDGGAGLSEAEASDERGLEEAGGGAASADGAASGTGGDGAWAGAAAEDPQPCGDRVAAGGGGADPGRPGAGERQGGSGGRGEGRSEPRSDHG